MMMTGDRAASRAVMAIAALMPIAHATVDLVTVDLVTVDPAIEVPAIEVPAIEAPAIEAQVIEAQVIEAQVIEAQVIVVPKPAVCEEAGAAASAVPAALAARAVDSVVVVSAAALAAPARSLVRPAECAAALVAAALVVQRHSTHESTASNRSSMKCCASCERSAKIVPSRRWDRRRLPVVASAAHVKLVRPVRGASPRPIGPAKAIASENVNAADRPIDAANAATTVCRS